MNSIIKLGNSPQKGLFLFFIFFTYGTYLYLDGEPYLQSHEIIQCSSRYADYFIPEILKLRAGIDARILKPLSSDDLTTYIHEFYLLILADEITVGCFRIFTPPTIPYALELGSVASAPGVKGAGRIIAEYAEHITDTVGKPVVSITGKTYGKTLEKQGWKMRTRWFEERIKQVSSPGKEAYIYHQK